MEALFDKDCQLVAWLDAENENIFDTNMNWIAFLSEDNIFSSTTKKWLGVYNKLACYDTTGRIVAWNPESPFEGMGTPNRPYSPYTPYTPYTPYKPYTPYTPYRPNTPYRGWSEISFNKWRNQ
ncbi:hypothetical protein MGI18_23175 [Bacillus sp. OVS6]|nr:hypothetical protein MGI18_23175 [Bacillus sp. OVS6]